MKQSVAGIVLGAFVSVAALPAVAAEFVWDMPNGFGARSSDGVADLLFTELVEQKSGGRIDIVNHFDGSLGYKMLDHLEAVQDGAVPLARQSMVYLGGFDPLFVLSTLPFLMQSKDDVVALYELSRPAYEELFLKYDQVLLSMGLFPPSGMWSRREVLSVDALQNFRLRVYDINGLETWQRAGAAAINMGWGDVLAALSTNALDGVLTSADLGIASNIQEFLPVFTEINWAIPLTAITINKDVWDGLPPDLQQVLREAGDETTRRTFDRLVTQVEKNYAEGREKGVTIVTDVPQPLFDHLWTAAQPTYEGWKQKASPEAQKILADYLQRVGR